MNYAIGLIPEPIVTGVAFALFSGLFLQAKKRYNNDRTTRNIF